MRPFLEVFVPLFVAIDVFGLLPIFLTFTEGQSRPVTRSIALEAVMTAAVVGVVFLLGGPWILQMVGVTVEDFEIAGGVLLVVLSIQDILSSEKRQRRVKAEALGIVPLGIPFIVGPAVLTTLLALTSTHPLSIIFVAYGFNLLIVLAVLWTAPWLDRMLGRATSRALSKVLMILLAAIGVAMIRRGIFNILR
jgi:multiple antibiotic resistance protein